MPDEKAMKAALQAYVDGYNNGDADAILALFADDAIVEDPVGTPPMRRAAFETFFRRGVEYGARLELVAPIRGSHGNEAAMAFKVTYVQDGRRITTHSLDTMVFDPSGKIVAMKGYWGPSDVEG